MKSRHRNVIYPEALYHWKYAKCPFTSQTNGVVLSSQSAGSISQPNNKFSRKNNDVILRLILGLTKRKFSRIDSKGFWWWCISQYNRKFHDIYLRFGHWSRLKFLLATRDGFQFISLLYSCQAWKINLKCIYIRNIYYHNTQLLYSVLTGTLCYWVIIDK
jgi:hypothetical protein